MADIEFTSCLICKKYFAYLFPIRTYVDFTSLQTQFKNLKQLSKDLWSENNVEKTKSWHLDKKGISQKD